MERNPSYIYSYTYQPEENWASYTQNLTPQSYSREDYIFDQECWFRVCVRREDGKDLSSEDFGRSDELIEYQETQKAAAVRPKPWFEQEIAETIASIRQFEQETAETIAPIRQKDIPHTMKLCLLTDTHYTVNGTWEDTLHNIWSVAAHIKYDAIVPGRPYGRHAPQKADKEICRKYDTRLGGLRCPPLYRSRKSRQQLFPKPPECIFQ